MLKLTQTYHIDSDKIKVWGLPLRRDFFNNAVSSLSEKYKKPENIFIFLLFSSEFGVGPLKKVIKEFCKKCGIFVIYGRNSAVKRYIASLRNPLYLLTFDYKEEIWELMRLSDLVVTKAGGLSVFECIARKKPILFMHSFYGQERSNVDFVLRHGLGFNPKTPQELINTISSIINNPNLLIKINKNFDKINVQDSAFMIKQLALSQT